MFLLALTALSVLALLSLAAGGLAVVRSARATGGQAAVRAAAQVLRPDTGMPDSAQTNHPVSLREARVTSDASSPSASAGVCPDLAESDDLETCNTSADAGVPASTHGSPPSASPQLTRGLALGVSYDWAGQLLPPRESGASGLDQVTRPASPKPRIECGDADKRRTTITTHPALL